MKPLRWFEIILLITVLTMLCTYLIPAGSELIFIRYTLSMFFMFLVPGNCLVNILFRKKNKLDIVEEAVLSVALSFGIIGISGLLFGLSPIGLDFTAITVSLSGITVVMAAAAFLLKNKELHQPEQQTTNEKPTSNIAQTAH
jgi:uncharacterized membrane protein